MSPLLELADDKDLQVGTVHVEPELEHVDDQEDGRGGSVDAGGTLPPLPPPRSRRRRPDRPPRWIRLLLYGAMLIACFLVGYGIGRLWARVDRAVWGDDESH